MSSGDDDGSHEDEILHRHSKERKELQAEITKMKYNVGKDKKRKKDLTIQIATLEAQLKERQEKELREHEKSKTTTTNNPSSEVPDDVVNAVEQMTIEPQQKQKKPSKAMKRREKQAQKERERDQRIKEGAKENLGGHRHVEYQKLKSMLKERGLAITEIPSDGDCLYAAIVDQLKFQNIDSSVKSLRKQTADYMRRHKDNFLPFTSHPQTGEILTLVEYEDYCCRIESSPEWGGQLEIQVLSEVLRLPVDVVQAEGSSVLTGEQYNDQPIILCYHRHAYGLGEHYNSVHAWTPQDDEVDEWSNDED